MHNLSCTSYNPLSFQANPDHTSIQGLRFFFVHQVPENRRKLSAVKLGVVLWIRELSCLCVCVIQMGVFFFLARVVFPTAEKLF